MCAVVSSGRVNRNLTSKGKLAWNFCNLWRKQPRSTTHQSASALGGRTLTALSPFGPISTSTSTLSPSLRLAKSSSRRSLWRKNTFLPSLVRMNPYPTSRMSRLIVPSMLHPCHHRLALVSDQFRPPFPKVQIPKVESICRVCGTPIAVRRSYCAYCAVDVSREVSAKYQS
jgi:hypothetical protein